MKNYLLQSQKRAQERIKQKAIVNMKDQLEEEKKRLTIEKADKAVEMLPTVMQDALDSEEKMEPRKTQIFKTLKAEKVFLQSKTSSNMPKLDKLLGSFLLSKRTQKYAVGLTKHCALLRQSASSSNWRYLGKSTSPELLTPIQKHKDRKCQKK